MKARNNKNQNVGTMQVAVDGFVFYRSYFEAIELLSTKNRLIAYEAIAKYALNEEKAINLPSGVLSLIKVIMPNLDANRRKYLKKKAHEAQANQKNTLAISEEQCPEKEAPVVSEEVHLEEVILPEMANSDFFEDVYKKDCDDSNEDVYDEFKDGDGGEFTD